MGHSTQFGSLHQEINEEVAPDPVVLVKTQAGSRMMPMNEYNNYLNDLEREFREDKIRKETEREKRREEREKRRKEIEEKREEMEKSKKNYILPQSLFGKFETDDPYFTDKVFPPHLYPHLYPNKFPELFPHIYGDKIHKMRAKQKKAKQEEEDLYIFKDPRTNNVTKKRKRTLIKLFKRAVRTISVFNLAYVNIARTIQARKQNCRAYFEENKDNYEEV